MHGWCHRCGHNAEIETAPLIADLARCFQYLNWQPHALHIMRGTRCRHAACMAPPWRQTDCTLWLAADSPLPMR